jgi:hypothetical protein
MSAEMDTQIEAAERGDDLKDIAIGCVRDAVDMHRGNRPVGAIDMLLVMSNVFMMGYIGEQLEALNKSVREANDLIVE